MMSPQICIYSITYVNVYNNEQSRIKIAKGVKYFNSFIHIVLRRGDSIKNIQIK